MEFIVSDLSPTKNVLFYIFVWTLTTAISPLSQNIYPLCVFDIPLPQLRTGFVYILVSICIFVSNKQLSERVEDVWKRERDNLMMRGVDDTI